MYPSDGLSCGRCSEGVTIARNATEAATTYLTCFKDVQGVGTWASVEIAMLVRQGISSATVAAFDSYREKYRELDEQHNR